MAILTISGPPRYTLAQEPGSDSGSTTNNTNKQASASGSNTDTAKNQVRSGQSSGRMQSSGGIGGRRDGKGRGVGGAGFGASISDEYSVYSAPFNFKFLGPVGFKGVLSYIDDTKDVLPGHSLAALTLGGRGKHLGVEFIAGAVLPTAESPLAEAQETNDPYASLSLMFDSYPLRLVLRLSHTDRLVYEDYDRGNITTAFLGFDFPVSRYLRFYSSIFQSQQEDDFDGVNKVESSLGVIDGSIGVVLPLSVDIRLGATIPLATESVIYSNSDRDITTDFGLRLDL